MKNTYRTAFMAACFFPGLLLPAASSEPVKTGPRSLKELCFDAIAYKSAKPENLALDRVSSNIVMAADITSHSNLTFTLENTDRIQSSVQKLSAKHLDITRHFISTNDGYEIRTPELRPIERSPSEDITRRLPDFFTRLYTNTLTISDCNFLLNNRSYYDFPANYLTHIDQLTELQTKVKTHFSRLCEGNIDPNAVSVFEDQKAALSKTVDDAISLTRKRMNDLSDYTQIIREICAEHNIEQKLRNLQEEAQVAEALHQVEVQQEHQRQRDEAEAADAIRRREEQAEYQRQRDEEGRIATRSLLLRAAIPTAFLALAGSAYMFKTAHLKSNFWGCAAAGVGPFAYWAASSIMNLDSYGRSRMGIPILSISFISSFLPILTDIYISHYDDKHNTNYSLYTALLLGSIYGL